MHASSRPFLILSSVCLAIGAGLIVYCLTWAFAWDEGFHLLAAQLILKGMRPYLDFFHAQTPLYAYWNAFWMRIFGDSWRTAHVASAVCTSIAVYLTGDFVLRHFENTQFSSWKLPCAITASVMTGLNSEVLQFGTIGQGYGVCLLGVVAAFRCVTLAVAKRDPGLAALTGFFAAVAAASSLLTVPMFPVLLFWMLYQSEPGFRWKKLAAFAGGAVIPFVPLLVLFAKSPFQVWFGAVKFHLVYRTVDWSGSVKQNVEVAASWMESPSAMTAGALLIVALVFLRRMKPEEPTEEDRRLRREFALCLWLALVESAYLLYVRPTFSRYFLFAVPFFNIVAMVGLYAIGTRIGAPDRPRWSVLIIALLMCLGAARTINGGKGDYRWKDWEAIGKKVDEVTRPGAPLEADEEVYFVTKRTPPAGMEYEDTHKLRLPVDVEARLHIFPKEELLRQIKVGVFDTVVNCDDEDTWNEWNLPKTYQHKAEVSDCAIFWGKNTPVQSK